MKVFVGLVESLNHQAQFITLVAPIARKTLFSDVIGSKTADFGFGYFEDTLVVEVLVVARTQMVDDTDCLAHEVHHVLRVSAGHVVLCEDLANALSEDEADIGDGVLVPKNGSDFCGGEAGFRKVKNEGLNRIFVGIGPCRCLGNMRTSGATLAFS